MANTDIDKILRDIKKRKEMSAAVPQVEKTEAVKPQPEKPAQAEKPVIPQPEKTEIENPISDRGKRTLANFINNAMPEIDTETDSYSAGEDHISKKSEDYIDENFMNFFTSSVIVTKGPQDTGKIDIKRKKPSFLRRGYVTDSLSLNIEKLEEEEQKLTRREKRRLAKEKERQQQQDMPIVKRASDVWAQPEEQPAEQPKPEKALKEKPVKEHKLKAIFGAVDTEDEFPPEVAQPEMPQPQEDMPSPVQETAETQPQPEEEVKVYKPKAYNPQSLSNILGDDKDPESLAKRILRQRKPQATAVAVAEREEAVQRSVQSNTIEIKRKTADVPDENDGIIGSIYTSILEKQAREALATDRMTGFIPEFEDEEDEEEKTIIKPVAEEAQEEEEVFRRYISKSEFLDKEDRESVDIQAELMGFRRTLNMRIFLGFVAGIVLTYFNLGAAMGLPLPSFIHPTAQPLMYAIACLAVYLIVFVGFLPTVLSGFKSLTDVPAPDSFVSLGAVLALLQLVVMCLTSATTDMTKTTVFAGFIAVSLGFNAMGKKIATNTILKNLTLANAPSGINAGYIVNDTEAVKRLARTLDEKVPKVLVSRKTGAITNFVNAGFSIHTSDYTARKTAIAGYAVTAICFVMGFVVSKNIATAVYCAAGASALMIPLSHTLVNSVPSALMQKTLEKVGALVNGWQGIDQLSKTTHVNFDAKHLFPRGTVILHGIKTFEKERIDLAILYAASVLIKECEVLKPVFMEVIDGKTDILPEVASCEYIELQGYVSWINDNRVIIGNRTLMEQYDVDMPPVSMENKFVNQGRKPVYLAVGGKLFGMFVFSYRPDEIVKENLERLMDKGVSVILSSKDFNIDPHLIQTVYGVPSDFISVLNQREANLLAQFTDYAEESECCVAHLDSLSSLVAGFRGAESAKSAESVCSIIQTVNVVIGAVLALLFTYAQTIMNLPLLSVMLLSFGFMGIAMLTAVAKKYE